MARSIIRGRHVFTRAIDRARFEQIDDGAVLQDDGTVLEVGPFDRLRRAHPEVAVIGSGRHALLPGLVNAHHHVGMTPLQLGSPDMPLELWFITRLVMKRVDPYLDTLYSAFEMIASGVTTVTHLQGSTGGTLKEVEASADAVIRAYGDIGMRVSYAFGVRDQNRIVYKDDQAFVASLPHELQGPMGRAYARFKMTLDEHFDLFEGLRSRHSNKDRVRIQLAPANLHWCSDSALERLAECSERSGAPLHIHLLETIYQREYARQRSGGTALEHLDRIGMLGPRLTLGHGVWLSDSDLDRVAESGTSICHNCSSNFRLRSGIAPLNAFERRRINVAIGIDEAGINDDRDMLQEMRMVLRSHRVPGMQEGIVPTIPQVLRMATSDGAATTGFGARIGTLTVGAAADMVLVDLDKVAGPYLDPLTPPLDAVLQRAKTSAVDLVMVGGEVIYEGGKFTRVDQAAALAALSRDLSRPPTEEEEERRRLSRDVMPHVRQLYRELLAVNVERWTSPEKR